MPLASINQDQGQLWFAQQIKAGYGVTNVFADAWSAPPFMKTNDSADNGGTLCGVPGATCSSGDWRQAYANYLKQYAADYSAAGDPLTYVGPENEANLAASYDSMVLSPAQTASFLDVLGPTMAAPACPPRSSAAPPRAGTTPSSTPPPSRRTPTASCRTPRCSPATATRRRPTSAAARLDQAGLGDRVVHVRDLGPGLDDGTDASGLTWAQHIYTGPDRGEPQRVPVLVGQHHPAENGDNESACILINGSIVASSGRLWAFANYSRYVRPGAVRIGATSSNSAVDLTAFKNTDGSVAVVALNTAASADPITYSLSGTGTPSGATVTPYLTNASSDTRRPGSQHGQRRRVHRDDPGPVAGHLRHPGQRRRGRRHADTDAHAHSHRLAHAYPHTQPHRQQRQLPGDLHDAEPVGGRVRGQRDHHQPGVVRDQRLDARLQLPRGPEDHQRLERVGHPERGERIHHQRQL